MDTIKKGNITEIDVWGSLVKKEYHIFTPITDGCSVDLIFIDNDGSAKRVQVKTSKKTGTGFSFDARKSTSSSRIRKKIYTSNEIDYYATIFENKCYLIPIKDCGDRIAILLRLNLKYKNQNDPLDAKKYLI